MTIPRSSLPAPGRRLEVFPRVAAILALALLAGCRAAPPATPWPPPPGSPTERVGVVLESWHAILVEPASEEPDARSRAWEFAARSWMMDGSTGFFGAARLLLAPQSGVGSREFPGPFSERFLPEAHPRRWVFEVTPEGARRMRTFLEASRGEPVPDVEGWHRARIRYRPLWNCNNYVARALREAGLPLAPRRAFTARLLARQLDRAASEAPAPPQGRTSATTAR